MLLWWWSTPDEFKLNVSRARFALGGLGATPFAAAAEEVKVDSAGC